MLRPWMGSDAQLLEILSQEALALLEDSAGSRQKKSTLRSHLA